MAEGARLESVFTGNRNVGSNPTPSATILCELTQLVILPRDSVKDCRILNAISALGAELVVQSKKIDDTSTYSDPIPRDRT